MSKKTKTTAPNRVLQNVIDGSTTKTTGNVKNTPKAKQNVLQSTGVENLIQHPYHQKIYGSRTPDYLKSSIERTGDQPVSPIVAVPSGDGKFWVVSGMIRLEILINKGYVEVPILVFNEKDEDKIKALIVDLNKARIKTGRELLNEFRHYLEMFPQRKGKKGSRYDRIGKEMDMGFERTKDLTMLNTFFHGDGDIVLESVFSGTLTVSQANQLKKVVELFPEKFNAGTFDKLCKGNYDLSRLEYAARHLDMNDDNEFDIVRGYLQKDKTPQEFHKTLEQLGKVEKIVKDHDDAKVSTQEITDTYTSQHAHIIHGDNGTVEFVHPFGKRIKCLIGSPPYGDRRQNGDDPEKETGHKMNGLEYGKFLADTYERYKPFMEPDGSVYVIIDDYKLPSGELACSIEYFVAEMILRGFYPMERNIWEKVNPMPRNYKGKTMTNSIEFVYRFTLDPDNYYSNPNLFLEKELPEGKKVIIQDGCTNHSGDGKTSRGGSYVQTHLKKLRNTLTEQDCIDVIKGNVARPEDFFRQAGEKRHTSTAPIYLTSTFILASTKPGDLCVDIWNGVGNTMVSALLLQREYVGIEKEENYYHQTVNRLIETETMIEQEAEMESDKNRLAA